MRLSAKAVAKLQALFLSEYGIELSNEAAHEIGLKVTRFVYAKEVRKKREFVPRPTQEYN